MTEKDRLHKILDTPASLFSVRCSYCEADKDKAHIFSRIRMSCRISSVVLFI